MNLLIIPVSGPLRTVKTHGDFEPKSFLHIYDQEGTLGSIDLRSDGRDFGRVWLLFESLVPLTKPENERARIAAHMLTSAHIQFRGPVMFEGLDDATVAELLAALDG